MQTTDPTSNAILSLRAKHGNDHSRCKTCCRAAGAPYRCVTTSGVILEGCVDACHTPHLAPVQGGSEQPATIAWHWRQGAQDIRNTELRYLRALDD